jgi:hypothetical protein
VNHKLLHHIDLQSRVRQSPWIVSIGTVLPRYTATAERAPGIAFLEPTPDVERRAS